MPRVIAMHAADKGTINHNRDLYNSLLSEQCRWEGLCTRWAFSPFGCEASLPCVHPMVCRLSCRSPRPRAWTGRRGTVIKGGKFLPGFKASFLALFLSLGWGLTFSPSHFV